MVKKFIIITHASQIEKRPLVTFLACHSSIDDAYFVAILIDWLFFDRMAVFIIPCIAESKGVTHGGSPTIVTETFAAKRQLNVKAGYVIA